jgi:glycosyltransferase involved in cell wall biosynthesis
MRLCIQTQYYPPEMGAPQARLSELARRFAAAGHQVQVLTAMPNYPRGRIYPGYSGLFGHERLDGIDVERAFIYPTKSVGLTRRLANYFSFVASSAAVGVARLPRVDYLLTESPPLFLGLSGWLLARLKRARWIFNVSDLWPESAVRLGIVGPGPGLRAAERLEAFCYRHAWLVTGQSREILASIGERFPGVATYHLSNGVDTELFRPDRKTAEMRQLLVGDTRASCVAIYAGLHGVAQGLGQVLEAAARLRDVDALAIVLVGDGPEKEELQARARTLDLGRVRFLDPQPREAMPALLASADLALVPLGTVLPGAVPSKLYEAMGAGLPVVQVASGEAERILADADAGVTVAPGDVDGLTQALAQLAGDPARRAALGTRGRAAAAKSYDRGAIAARFIAHLEEQL